MKSVKIPFIVFGAVFSIIIFLFVRSYRYVSKMDRDY